MMLEIIGSIVVIAVIAYVTKKRIDYKKKLHDEECPKHGTNKDK